MQGIGLFPLLALLAFGPAVVHAQQSTSDTSVLVGHQAPVVMIALDGDVVVHATHDATISAHAEAERSGRVIGYSNADRRPAYAITIERTTYGYRVVPARRPTLVTIGFSSLHEDVRQDVYVPAAATVCIRSGRGSVRVQGRFASILIADNPRTLCDVEDGR